MTNENVKTQVINDVIVAMSAYIAADLMSQAEKIGVEEGFQQFLNTLRHPILRIVWINRMST